MWHNYTVSDTVFKTKEPVTLWKTERGFVQADKDTLVVAVKSGERCEGYVFHGRGKLVLDAIVETESGAVGEPVEKEHKSPFLMLGETEEIQQHLSEAVNDDLTKSGYRDSKEFVHEANSVLERLLTRRGLHGGSCCSRFRGSMFMFPNETSRPDVLLFHNSKLVYESRSMVFVSHGGKAILKTPRHVMISHNGKYCTVCHH